MRRVFTLLFARLLGWRVLSLHEGDLVIMVADPDRVYSPKSISILGEEIRCGFNARLVVIPAYPDAVRFDTGLRKGGVS